MPYAKASHKTLLQKSGAGDEARTRDLNLGKVALYQLSYSRIDGLHAPTTTVCYANLSASFTVTRYCDPMERETRLELATSTLARLRSTS